MQNVGMDDSHGTMIHWDITMSPRPRLSSGHTRIIIEDIWTLNCFLGTELKFQICDEQGKILSMPHEISKSRQRKSCISTSAENSYDVKYRSFSSCPEVQFSSVLYKYPWTAGDITEEAEWPFNFTWDHPNTVSGPCSTSHQDNIQISNDENMKFLCILNNFQFIRSKG